MVQVKGSNDNVNFTLIKQFNGDTSYDDSFNSGEYTYYTVQLFFTGESGASGDGVEYTNFMVCTKAQYDLSPSFEPYHESVEEYAFPRSEQAVLGATNINATLYEANENAGVVWTPVADGVTAVGTATGGNSQIGYVSLTRGPFEAPFTGQVYFKGGINQNAHVYAYDATNNARPFTDSTKTTRQTNNQYGDTPLSFYMEKGVRYTLVCRVMNGTQIDGKFQPMLSTSPNAPYAPYAMTNRELTDAVTPKKLEETSTSEQAARITVPTSFRIAYAFVSIDSDKTFQCVIVKGISSRAFRFTYKYYSNTEVRGYIWYDYTNSRIEVGSFMVNDVEMKNDTNIKLEVFYI